MKRRMTVAAIAALLMVVAVKAQCSRGAAAATGTTSQVDPAKAQEIRHMLDVMGVTKQAADMLRAMLPQMMKMMEDSMKSSMANSMPPGGQSADAQQRLAEYEKTIDRLMQEKMLQKFDKLDLYSIYVPVYDKYFSIEDVQAITAFYESPAGRKMLSTMAPMVADVMAAMSPVMMKMTADIQNEIFTEHPELNPKNWH